MQKYLQIDTSRYNSRCMQEHNFDLETLLCNPDLFNSITIPRSVSLTLIEI